MISVSVAYSHVERAKFIIPEYVLILLWFMCLICTINICNFSLTSNSSWEHYEHDLMSLIFLIETFKIHLLPVRTLLKTSL